VHPRQAGSTLIGLIKALTCQIAVAGPHAAGPSSCAFYQSMCQVITANTGVQPD
jgi:hypothetical protein